MNPGEWLSSKIFSSVHGSNLVYNQCWEDPRLDRQALNIGSDDRVMVITSAGCNALDYALLGPREVHAVDLNPRQNALLELKQVGIRQLSHSDFWSMFGRGRIDRHKDVYRDVLRPHLSAPAQQYWDRKIHYFSGKGWRHSFYFHGTSGLFARVVNLYIDRKRNLRDAILRALDANSLEEQQAIYEKELRPVFWSGSIRWALGRDSTLSLLGVPRPQRFQLDRQYPGGVVQFIEDCIDTVFSRLPLQDNYFWRVYMTGEYTPACCPEYLKPDNFAKLKAGLVDRIRTHTCSVQQFLERYQGTISRFVLLDHMDWLSTARLPLLQQEWQAIVDRAAADSRMIWRSAGVKVDFVDPLEVTIAGQKRRVGDLLRYDPDLAQRLHPLDRVHTYGSFYIADLHAPARA